MSHEQDRRKKLSNLLAANQRPYGQSVFVSMPIAGIRTQYRPEFQKDSGPVFHSAGRVILHRDMGKLAFLTIRDNTSDIQIALDQRKLSESGIVNKNNLDLGDLVSCTGNLGATQKGEITIWATEFAIVAKALTPPPDKHDGLKDIELRYRNRHVDLFSNPEVLRVMETRSRIVKAIRHELGNLNYMEVETPILQTNPGGANAKPFKTHHNALNLDVSLRIAPELYLKRLLIGGLPKVFEIGKNFRNEGISHKHNPEFTVLEAYQAWGSATEMMFLMERLVRTAAKECDIELPFTKKVSLTDLVSDKLSDEQMMETYEKEVEPTLIEPTFVTGFPSSLVPLAREDAVNPRFAECFELVMNGQEVGPGYTECNDPDQQLRHFQTQCGKDKQILDQDFIDAMKYGMPPAGGLGLGIDRLVAILTKQQSVRDVILFPLMK